MTSFSRLFFISVPISVWFWHVITLLRG